MRIDENKMSAGGVRFVTRALAGLISMIVAVALAGCGEGPREEIPPGEFEAAITRYLTERSFEMKPTESVIITVSEGEARATWKLKHADSDLGMAVTWEFRLEKKNDVWSVINHSPR